MAVIGQVPAQSGSVGRARVNARAPQLSTSVVQALRGVEQRADQAFESQRRREDVERSEARKLEDEFKRRQTNVQRANVQTDLINAQGELTRQVAEMPVPRSGVGFTDTVDSMVSKRVEEIRRRIPEELRPDFESNLAQLRQSMLTAALGTELTAQDAAYGQDYQNLMQAATDSMLSDPAVGMEDWAEALDNFFASSPLDPLQTEQLADAAMAQLQTIQLGRELEDELKNAERGRGVTGQSPDGSDIVAAGVSAPMRAILNVAAGVESSGSYDVMYGGERFTDFSQHPNKPVRITSGPHEGKTSTAAGRYQMLYSTWVKARDALGLTDFSPESQDRAAIWLAKDFYASKTGRNLEADLASGDPVLIERARRTLAGNPETGQGVFWEGFQKLSPEEFRRRLAVSEGTPSSLITDPRFSNVPMQNRQQMAIEAQLQNQQAMQDMLAQQKAAMQSVLEQTKATIQMENMSLPALTSIMDEYKMGPVEREELTSAWQTKNAEDLMVSDFYNRMSSGAYVYSEADKEAADVFAARTILPALASRDPAMVNEMVLPTLKAMGHIPSSVSNELSNLSRSSDIATASYGLGLMNALYGNNPGAFQLAFDEDAESDVIFFQNAQRVLSDDEMREALQERRRPSLSDTAIDSAIKKIATEDPTKFAPKSIAKMLDLPQDFATGRSGQALEAEYMILFRREYELSGGNERQARRAVKDRLAARWGQSTLGSAEPYTLRRPLENFHPAFEGSHAYVDEQIRSVLPEGTTNYRVVPDHITEAEIARGEPPAYMIWLPDDFGTFNPVFDSNNKPIRFRPEITAQMQNDLIESHAWQNDKYEAQSRLNAIEEELVQEQNSVRLGGRAERLKELEAAFEQLEEEITALENDKPALLNKEPESRPRVMMPFGQLGPRE